MQALGSADIFSRRFCRRAYARRDEAVLVAGAAAKPEAVPAAAPPPAGLSPEGLSRVCSVVTMLPP